MAKEISNNIQRTLFETCNAAGMYGDYLAKEFVLSLKEIAFDWYSDFQPIDSWERLEQEFLNRFYSTRRVVSTMELTKALQGKDESVVS